ncbi:hypothetical protein IV203_001260 [Nitzschia inconspicua]|uniref:Uncharacterized protein n=1 Tax=Nitzschia inconspicua TaxID=303405 RepID=A0A9K3L7D8_9STRA|nr:hypothetical protein IV203_001260 [Nitzschia inconspicua]
MEHRNKDPPTKLPPPNLTTEQVDLLLKKLRGGATTSSEPTTISSLKGQKVLIPFGRCAFWEGELNPSTFIDDDVAKVPEERTSNIVGKRRDSAAEGEEEVYISTKRHTVSTSEALADDLISVPLSRAIGWLEEYSSSSIASKQRKAAQEEPAKAKIVTKRQVPSTTKTPSSGARPTSTSDDMISFPMVEIQEEYTEDGQQLYGKAIDITSRLEALWKHEDGSSRHRQNEEEKYDHETGVEYSMTSTNSDNGENPHTKMQQNVPNMTDQDSKVAPTISDEEYDRLSQRLEELAFFEEQEQQIKAAKKKSAGLTFQKGFLNAVKPKSKRIATTNKTSTGRADESTKTSISPNPDLSGVNRKSKVTIGENQNKVKEIPQEGRQQPVPPRQGVQQTSSRMIDPSLFSGLIQERTDATTAGNRDTPAVASSSGNNTTKKKRVSRFAQERQQQHS